MLWVIGITVLATSLLLVLLQNFKTPDKPSGTMPSRMSCLVCNRRNWVCWRKKDGVSHYFRRWNSRIKCRP